MLTPEHPHVLHVLLLRAAFAGWDTAKQARCLSQCWHVQSAHHLRKRSLMHAQGPIPVWSPTAEGVADTNLAAFMQSFQVLQHSSAAAPVYSLCFTTAFCCMHAAEALLHASVPAMQGPPEWQQHTTGDPQADLPLLQRLSCSHPEHFWPPVLRALRIRFHAPPSRQAFLVQISAGPSACACPICSSNSALARARWRTVAASCHEVDNVDLRMQSKCPSVWRTHHNARGRQCGAVARACRMLEAAASPDDCRWLPGARLNIAESALCARDEDAPALLWAEEESPEVCVCHSAGVLRSSAPAMLLHHGTQGGTLHMLHGWPCRVCTSSAPACCTATAQKMHPAHAAWWLGLVRSATGACMHACMHLCACWTSIINC